MLNAWGQLKLYKAYWELTDDGDAFETRYSLLQPVIYWGTKAMLKIAVSSEERRGASLMIWWDGDGALEILKYDEHALLMERATGNKSLVQMVRNGDDDAASRIICSVAVKLHAPRNQPIPDLIPLPLWFKDLNSTAHSYGGMLLKCNEIADKLLNDPRDIVVLHGDIHHDNILDSGERGWLAIDPKGLIGERGFDFANIFCNPDIKIATAPGRLPKQVQIVADEACLDIKRLLQWIIAWAGLSASWLIIDDEDPRLPLKVAEIAINELNNF